MFKMRRYDVMKVKAEERRGKEGRKEER